MRALILILFASTCLAQEDFVDVKQVLLGNSKLPGNIPVTFTYKGSELNYDLKKDEKMTSLLSDSIFERAPHLPKNVFDEDKNREDFAIYRDDSNTFVLHRHDINKPCKMYGSFSLDGVRYVLMAQDDHDTNHNVVREEFIRGRPDPRNPDFKYRYQGGEGQEGHRSKRAVTQGTTKIIELFLFADYSIWEDLAPIGGTNNEIKIYIRDMMKSFTKDLDSMFHLMSNYSTVELRVYFQEYQVATRPEASPWAANNLVLGSILSSVALTDFQSYMNFIINNLFFPVPDISLALTKYDLRLTSSDTTTRYFVSSSGVCAGGASAAGIVEINDGWAFRNLAQAVAQHFGVSLDGDGNSCNPLDLYVMSDVLDIPTSVQYQNPWTFSNCSTEQFNTYLNSLGSPNCLLEEDFQFDWPTFEASPNYGESFSLDEQCENIFGAGTASCNANVFGCWEGIGCSVAGVCETLLVGQLTPCSTPEGVRDVCDFNLCNDYPGPPEFMTSTAGPSSILPSSTNIPTSQRPECEPIDAGETYFDIPCSCGCTDDDGNEEKVCYQTNQDSCPPGSGDCDCCAGQVKVDIKYLPPGCDIGLGPLFKGNSTRVIDAPGANIAEVFTTGYVYFDGSNWQVHI